MKMSYNDSEKTSKYFMSFCLFCLVGLMIQNKLRPATQLWSAVYFFMAHEAKNCFYIFFYCGKIT